MIRLTPSRKTITGLAMAALTVSVPAHADTLVDNIQGITVGEDGKVMDDGYTMAFEGMTIRATFSDSKIKDGDQNRMVRHISSMFDVSLERSFAKNDGHDQDRFVLLERDLKPLGIDRILQQTRRDNEGQRNKVRNPDPNCAIEIEPGQVTRFCFQQNTRN